MLTVAVLHEFIPNVGDAWTYTLDELTRYFERVQSAESPVALANELSLGSLEEAVATDPRASMIELSKSEVPPLAQHLVGEGECG